MWHESFRRTLKSQFELIREKNPRVSLRGFAQRVGLSPSAMSQILRGTETWALSPERAHEIIDRLGLCDSLKNSLLAQMGAAPVYSPKPLPPDLYELLQDWAYFPIWMHFDLREAQTSLEFIAGRLGLPVERVRTIVEDLIRRGLVEREASGRYLRKPIFLETEDGTANEFGRRFHEIGLRIAESALRTVPRESRDFSSLTFVGNAAKLPQLREEIRRFEERVMALMGDGAANDHVYQFSVQMFPFDFKQGVNP